MNKIIVAKFLCDFHDNKNYVEISSFYLQNIPKFENEYFDTLVKSNANGNKSLTIVYRVSD